MYLAVQAWGKWCVGPPFAISSRGGVWPQIKCLKILKKWKCRYWLMTVLALTGSVYNVSCLAQITYPLTFHIKLTHEISKFHGITKLMWHNLSPTMTFAVL